MTPDRLARRYSGVQAAEYDARRGSEEKWVAEQNLVERYLRALPEGANVLDMPVGTGRFLDFYRRFELVPTGMDLSSDMLAQAAAKAEAIGVSPTLRRSDVRKIEAGSGEFELVICVRLLNLLGAKNFDRAITELARVSRRLVLCGVRSLVPLRELARDAQLSQWPLQQMMSAYRSVNPNALTIHDRKRVLEVFERNHLKVRECSAVVPRRRGVDYFIYLLEKS